MPVPPFNGDRDTMEKKNKNFLESFRNAFHGVRETLIRERNFKIHLCAAVCAIGASLYFKIDALAFAAVILAICMVMTAELINTAVEAMVDLYCGNFRSENARRAKDAAAGAVLLSSVFAVMIGVAVFWAPVTALLQR